MISRELLLDAIDRCESEPLTPAKRSELADLYIIYNNLFPQSNSTEKNTKVKTSGDSDFLLMVNGKNLNDVWGIIDELVATIQLLQPNLYYGFISKISEL